MTACERIKNLLERRPADRASFFESLWPETIEAVRKAIEERPDPKDEQNADLVFVTKYGQSWNENITANPLSAEFRKLLKAIDADAKAQAETMAEVVRVVELLTRIVR